MAADTITTVPDLTILILDTMDIIPIQGTKTREGSIPTQATTQILIPGIRILDTQPEMEDTGASEVS